MCLAMGEDASGPCIGPPVSPFAGKRNSCHLAPDKMKHIHASNRWSNIKNVIENHLFFFVEPEVGFLPRDSSSSIFLQEGTA